MPVSSSLGEEFELPRLPGAETESGWVAEALGGRLLTGAQATETAVRNGLPPAPVVHLATHGYIYGTEARVRSSFIALAADAANDGFLTLGEVLDDPVLELRADLVVLSACQTGLGDLREAEGTVGLQRAFLARGARSVLVSLWSVSDDATAVLMRSFYTHWRHGSSKVEALRRAQEEVRGPPGSRFHAPRYWAAFQLIGAR
jgi:CHAT domain-containing protein